MVRGKGWAQATQACGPCCCSTVRLVLHARDVAAALLTRLPFASRRSPVEAHAPGALRLPCVPAAHGRACVLQPCSRPDGSHAVSTVWWGWVLRSDTGITPAGADTRRPTAFFFCSYMACHLPFVLLVAGRSTSFARRPSAPIVLWRLPPPTSCGGTTWSGTRVRGVLLFSAQGVPCGWCNVLLFQSNARHVGRLQFTSQPTAPACPPPPCSPHAAVGPLPCPNPAAGHLVHPARRPCSSSRGAPPTPSPAGECSGVVCDIILHFAQPGWALRSTS